MPVRQQLSCVSLSDMMTGLMLVFLLISILATSHVVERRRSSNEMVRQFEVTKQDIYEDLQSTFGTKEDEWGLTISQDLSITFENPIVLFGYRSAVVSPRFHAILDEFVPRYLS